MFLQLIGPALELTLVPGTKRQKKMVTLVQVYAAWETDEVIGFELWRNLGLGTLCVFVITIILLADLRICFFVLVT
jgi:hypothetical protein